MTPRIYRSAIASILLLQALDASSQASFASPQDSLSYELDSTRVVALRNRSHIKMDGSGDVVWSMEQMKLLPQILGSADPIHYVSLLPGVQTCSELNGGVHILGSENSHNDINIGGVPVYGVSHLFGIFSAFNPSHFRSCTVSLHPTESQRIGGGFSMNLPDSVDRKMSADLFCGLMSAQGTLRVPTGPRSSLTLSARRSFMNLLYSDLLSLEGNSVLYAFSDYNLTWTLQDGKNDTFWLNAYTGSDNSNIIETKYTAEIGASWGNALCNARWLHDFGNSTLDQNIFCTAYRCDGAISHDILNVGIPSSICTFGYEATWRGRLLSAGIDACFHTARPQRPIVDGVFVKTTDQSIQLAFEIVPELKLDSRSEGRTRIEAGVQFPFFANVSDGSSYVRISPYALLRENLYTFGSLTATVGLKHQSLFKAGFSDIGLPIEFWFLANAAHAPQSSLYSSIDYSVELLKGACRLNARVYGARLRNQIEYDGSILDLITTTYDLENVLIGGDGWNWGLLLMASKQTGNFTGWVSYSYTRAPRHFETLAPGTTFPAAHERPHEFDAVATYRLGRWDFGGTGIVASGTPYTHPEFLYVASGQIMSKYRPHNSGRLRPYARIDVCAKYNFKPKGRFSSGLNFSIYNLTARKNDLCYRIKVKDDRYKYQRVGSFMRVLPSLGYFCNF